MRAYTVNMLILKGNISLFRRTNAHKLAVNYQNGDIYIFNSGFGAVVIKLNLNGMCAIKEKVTIYSMGGGNPNRQFGAQEICFLSI